MFKVQRRLQAIIMRLLLWFVSTDRLERDKTYLKLLRPTVRGPMDTGVKGENKLKKSVFYFHAVAQRRTLSVECGHRWTCFPENLSRGSEMENVDVDCHTLARPRHFLQRLHMRSFFLRPSWGCSDPPIAVGIV